MDKSEGQARDTGGNMAVYRDPVIVWRDERQPNAMPLPEAPPGPFKVTRSEIIIRPSTGAVVHIWCTREPAVPAHDR